jgi:hypothetical protein
MANRACGALGDRALPAQILADCEKDVTAALLHRGG